MKQLHLSACVLSFVHDTSCCARESLLQLTLAWTRDRTDSHRKSTDVRREKDQFQQISGLGLVTNLHTIIANKILIKNRRKRLISLEKEIR